MLDGSELIHFLLNFLSGRVQEVSAIDDEEVDVGEGYFSGEGEKQGVRLIRYIHQ